MLRVFVAALAALPFVELLAANRDQPLHLPRVALYGGAMVLFLTMILLLVGRREQARTRRAAVLLGVFAWLVFRVPTIDSWWDRLGLDGSDPIEWAIVTAAVFALAIPLSRRPGVQTWAFVVGPALVVVPLAPLGIQPFDASGRSLRSVMRTSSARTSMSRRRPSPPRNIPGPPESCRSS